MTTNEILIVCPLSLKDISCPLAKKRHAISKKLIVTMLGHAELCHSSFPTSHIHLNGISYPLWTLAEVAPQALGVPLRPMTNLPQNVLFNEMCLLSLKDITCRRLKKKTCDLTEAFIGLCRYFPNS